MAEFDDFPGIVLDEKYRLEKLLGKGGMGAVFLATHLGTERPVAVKLMAPRLMQNNEFIRRFSREAKAAGRLRHPNVVDVTDFGVARTARGPLAYLVMEYLDGCTLADILAEENELPLDWAADILEQTCSAVHEAHQFGIVHRDLKPDNIWLEPNRLGGYRVKVLDFGLAKLAENAPATPNDKSSPPDTTALSPAVDENAVTLEGNAVTLAEDAPTSERPRTAWPAGVAATKMVVDEEAATIALPKIDEEAATLALPASPDDDEPATREMSSSALAAAALQAIVGMERSHTPDTYPSTEVSGTPAALHSTDLDGKVTRVGAIIGTPLYMSPEQCRGEKLSTATDVYSLGVIAYQMLAGETPFSGNSLQVIRQHREATPVPLREKNPKVPRKIAALVMSALAKDPSQRPSSVEAFASKFRASTEGVGTLLQKASSLYGERFVTLTKISLLVHLPMIFFMALFFLRDGLIKWGYLGDTGGQVWGGLVGFASFIGNYVSTSLISGMTVLVVLQLNIAPLRPVRGREVLRMVWARFKPLLWTSFLIFVLALLASGIVLGAGMGISLLLAKFVSKTLGIVSGVLTALLVLLAFATVIVRNSLYAPIVLVEELSGRAVMRRSSRLVSFALGTVIMVTAVQWVIPVVVGVGAQFLVAGISDGVPKFVKTGTGIKLQTGGAEAKPGAPTEEESEAQREARSKNRAYHAEVAGRLGGLLNILIVPVIAIINALLYLKLRQLAGESRKALLDSFENADMPTSRWQQRMRERLTLTAPSKGTSAVSKNSH